MTTMEEITYVLKGLAHMVHRTPFIILSAFSRSVTEELLLAAKSPEHTNIVYPKLMKQMGITLGVMSCLFITAVVLLVLSACTGHGWTLVTSLLLFFASLRALENNMKLKRTAKQFTSVTNEQKQGGS
tara:strand:+ start:282 stop:665 length:384 start_codon:yes stop_codon:yes gene_type:complete